MDRRSGLIPLALFGSPVGQSLSPRIHALFAEQAGLTVRFDARETLPGTLAEALEAFAEAGGRGCNITLPLKQEAMSLAATRSDRVNRAGAANTLLRSSDGWHAETTDGAGLVADLEQLGLSPAGRRLIVVGAGGATAGVLSALLEAGAARIDIYNRTAATAEDLAARHADLGEVHGHGLKALASATPAELVLNATSLGHQGGVPPLHAALFGDGAACYDLNYGAAARPLLDWCADRGIRARDGLGMLVGQAAASFELWTGFAPDPAPVLAALR